jgi:glycosyltransferase involved in cell wall biosynthesis
MAGAGPFEAEVKARALGLGLENAVTFVGFLSDVSSFSSILDVQLNASYGTEATSLSLLEGMSLGLPAVVSDYGGNPWLIENGKTGLVFKSRDSADLAAALHSSWTTLS